MKKSQEKRTRQHVRQTPKERIPPQTHNDEKADSSLSEQKINDRKVISSTSDDLEFTKKLKNSIDELIPDQGERSAVVKRLPEVSRSEHFMGPLLHPIHLERYETVSPGAGSRVIKMAETAQRLAEDRRDQIVANDHIYSMTGMGLATGILIVVAICGTVLSLGGQPVIGTSVLVISALSVIASKFIDGRKTRTEKKNRKNLIGSRAFRT